MGVSARKRGLSPKCDTSKHARLCAVLIMIVNNNRARHRRLPDVMRALRCLRTYPTIGTTPDRLDARRLDRRESDYLSIISTHTHTIGFWFARRTVTVYYSRRVIVPGARRRGRACGFDRPDFINTVATMRANTQASERANSRKCARGASSCIVTDDYLDTSDVRSATDAFSSNL